MHSPVSSDGVGCVFFRSAANWTGHGSLSVARLASCDSHFVRHTRTTWSGVHQSDAVASPADEHSAPVLASRARPGTCHDVLVQESGSLGPSPLAITRRDALGTSCGGPLGTHAYVWGSPLFDRTWILPFHPLSSPFKYLLWVPFSTSPVHPHPRDTGSNHPFVQLSPSI